MHLGGCTRLGWPLRSSNGGSNWTQAFPCLPGCREPELILPAHYMINVGNAGYTLGAIFRAWSDGRIEHKLYGPHTGHDNACVFPENGPSCGWQTFSDPAAGLAAKADITNDKVVDASDLSYLLAAWGDAPPVGIPPSDCPLNLINP